MYIATIPNRSSPPAILLREAYREGGKVKNRTLANLTHWAPERIEALRNALRGEGGSVAGGPFTFTRSLPHGHVAAVLGKLKQLGLDLLLSSRRSRMRDLCLAMIVAWILEPGSKLTTAARWRADTAKDTTGKVLGIEDVEVDELYEALDWLLERQPKVETELARRHLKEGSLVLYDLTSTWFEGRTCPLARLGYPRDKKRGKLQIEFGVMADVEGRPVGVEVFAGNTSDPKTLAVQIEKIRERFGIEHVVLVGDRGMITDARIREDLAPVPGLEWITALRAPAVHDLVRKGAFQLSLFDERDLAEIAHPDYPGERLVVCRNPLLALERARKRADLLAATEKELQRVAEAVRRERTPLRGSAKIGLRLGRVLGRFKMAKHFDLQIAEDSFTWSRKEASIAEEAALDGIYVLRTCVPADRMDAPGVVRSYKALTHVERLFRGMKISGLQVRPIRHRLEDRVRAHVFLCVLAAYVEWHMRHDLAPLLFDETDPEAAAAARASIVAPAKRSPAARAKAATKKNDEGLPVQSFRSLIKDLGTIVRNRVEPADGAPSFDQDTRPTPLQARAFELLSVPPRM